MPELKDMPIEDLEKINYVEYFRKLYHQYLRHNRVKSPDNIMIHPILGDKIIWTTSVNEGEIVCTYNSIKSDYM